MSLSCGIDLHATNSYVVVLDESDRAVLEKRIPNRLEALLAELEPFRESLKGVAVESTFNWYGLGDGLEDHGYPIELVNTTATKQYEGLKSRDDRHDARWIAHMLRLGILPTGHVLAREDRAVRDLLRRRSKVVRQKTATLLALKNLIARNTGRMVSASELKRLQQGTTLRRSKTLTSAEPSTGRCMCSRSSKRNVPRCRPRSGPPASSVQATGTYAPSKGSASFLL